jgi:hypothetical protein
MAISLVDINQLTATISKDKAMLIPIDEPAGLGFVIRKIEKEDFFKLLGHGIQIDTAVGQNDLWTFGAGTHKIFYADFGAGSFMMWQVPLTGVTANGTNYSVAMSAAGQIVIGNAATPLNGSINIFHSDDLVGSLQLDLFDLLQSAQLEPAALTGGVYNARRAGRAMLQISQAGTIATYTVNFPPDPGVGHTFELYVKNTITALTLACVAPTVIDQPLTTATNQGAKWMYIGGATDAWRRLY